MKVIWNEMTNEEIHCSRKWHCFLLCPYLVRLNALFIHDCYMFGTILCIYTWLLHILINGILHHYIWRLHRYFITCLILNFIAAKNLNAYWLCIDIYLGKNHRTSLHLFSFEYCMVMTFEKTRSAIQQITSQKRKLVG